MRKFLVRVSYLAVFLSFIWSVPPSLANDEGSTGSTQITMTNETKVVDVSVGYSHACAISDQGILRCWGDNTYGQIDVPEDLGPVSQVSAGYYVTCAIAAEDQLVCWGGDRYGLRVIPQDVGLVKSVGVGASYICVIEISNQLKCWGGDWRWQSGTPAGSDPVIQVSVGPTHFCAVTADHIAKCWGSNWSGEASVPSDLGQVSQVVASADWSCAITLAGKIRCWGEDIWWTHYLSSFPTVTNISVGGTGYSGIDYLCGQANSKVLSCIGTLSYNGYPEPVDLGTISKVDLGATSACAISEAGALRCWGSNTLGQTDIPPALDFPVLENQVPRVVGCINYLCPENSRDAYARYGDELRVEAGTWGSGATLSYQWFLDSEPISGATGETYVLQLADIDHLVSVQVRGSAPGVLDVTLASSAVTITKNYLVASGVPVIKNSAGYEFDGPTEVGSVILVDPGTWSIPVEFSYQWLRDDEAITGATGSSYKITGLDWGHELKARVTGSKPGYESDAISTLPVTVGDKGSISFGPITKQISSSATYACAIDSTDNLTCWGDNMSGRLSVPANLGKVKQVAVSGTFICAIKMDDTASCWGMNYHGELDVPSDLGPVLQISSGYSFVCAVKSNQNVRCWGNSGSGSIAAPNDLGRVSQVSAGVGHACAITLPGGVRCWGVEWAIGVPSTLTSAVQISAGDSITCAVDRLGKITCWGARYEDSRVCEYGLHNLICNVGPFATVCSTYSSGERVCVDGKIPEDIGPAVSVSVGGIFASRACAVLVSGGSRCWGLNQGSNIAADAEYGKASSLIQDRNHLCLLTESGRVQCQYVYDYKLIPPKELTLSYVNLKTPLITGISRSGSDLQVQVDGSYTVINYSYVWLRDDTPISGATGNTYTLTSLDVNHKISLKVVASGYGYNDATITVNGQNILPGTLGVVPTPKITGDRKVDSILSVAEGLWPEGVNLSYQWLRDGIEIYGENGSSYRIKQMDVGRFLSVRVTGQKTGYQSASVSSSSVRAISNQPPIEPVPYIVGSNIAGSTLKAHPGHWGDGYFISFRWLRDGQAIPGAVSQTYVPNFYDRGTQLSVEVTGKIPNTAPVSYRSKAVQISGSILKSALSGKFQLGGRIWANISGRSRKFDYSFQWFRNGNLIEGENSRSLVLGVMDVDKNISVRVCATVGYIPIDCAEATSPSQIKPGQLKTIPVLIVTSGTSTLVLRVGAGLPADNVYYEWFRDGALISGANQNSYQLRPGDTGHNFSAKILVFAPGYQPAEYIARQRFVR